MPGANIEWIGLGPSAIEGVPTSIAFLDETERGSLTPGLVTSYPKYERWFGGTLAEAKFLPRAVRGFFENGGQALYVCRLVGPRATPAEATFGKGSPRSSPTATWRWYYPHKNIASGGKGRMLCRIQTTHACAVAIDSISRRCRLGRNLRGGYDEAARSIRYICSFPDNKFCGGRGAACDHHPVDSR